MIAGQVFEDNNFTEFRESTEYHPTNYEKRTDYLSVAKVGKAEYLVVAEYYEDGKLKIKDYWNDPLYYPEYYFFGNVTTEEEFIKALEDTRFETFHVVDLNKLYEYK